MPEIDKPFHGKWLSLYIHRTRRDPLGNNDLLNTRIVHPHLLSNPRHLRHTQRLRKGLHCLKSIIINEQERNQRKLMLISYIHLKSTEFSKISQLVGFHGGLLQLQITNMESNNFLNINTENSHCGPGSRLSNCESLPVNEKLVISLMISALSYRTCFLCLSNFSVFRFASNTHANEFIDDKYAEAIKNW